MKLVLCALMLVSLLFGQTPATLVTGTVTDSTGTNFDGTLTIQWNQYRDADDNLVSAGSMKTTVSAGSVRVLLPPSLLTSRSANKTNFAYDVFGVNTANGSVYAAKWVVPIMSPGVAASVSSVSGGAGGGGSGSGTVANQTTNAVTVGGADATTVKGSGCTVSGASLDTMTCNKFNSAGDVSASGAIDLKGKTSLKYWTEQANDALATGTVEIQPSNSPASVGQAKRVKTRTTGQTVVYADGTDTSVTVAELEWYTPQNLTGIVNEAGKDSAVLFDGIGCRLYTDVEGVAPPYGVLTFDCSSSINAPFDGSKVRFKDSGGNIIEFSSDSFGWDNVSGFALPVKTPAIGTFLQSSANNIATTTVFTGNGNITPYIYCTRASGTGSAVITVTWNDFTGATRTAVGTLNDSTPYWAGPSSINKSGGNLTIGGVGTGTLSYTCLYKFYL